MDEWSTALTHQIGKQVLRLRGPMTTQALSDRTAELGKRISKASISELETGKRKSVSVADAVVLSAALGVPLVELLCPGLPDERIVGAMDRPRTAWETARWYTGERTNDSLISLVRQREDVRHRLLMMERQLEHGGDPEKVMSHIEVYRGRIRSLNREIAEAGGVILDG